MKIQTSLHHRLTYSVFVLLSVFLVVGFVISFLILQFGIFHQKTIQKLKETNRILSQNYDEQIAHFIQDGIFLTKTIRLEFASSTDTNQLSRFIQFFENSHHLSVFLFLKEKHLLFQDQTILSLKNDILPWFEKLKQSKDFYHIDIEKDPFQKEVNLTLTIRLLNKHQETIGATLLKQPLSLPNSKNFHHYLLNQNQILLDFSDPYGSTKVLSKVRSFQYRNTPLKNVSWQIISFQTTNGIPPELQKELITIFFLLLILLFLIGISGSHIIANKVLTPLKDLLKKSEQIASNPSQNFEIKDNFPDEIGMLSFTLQKIQKELFQYKHKLEDLIQTRTRSLNFSVTALKEKEQLIEQEIKFAASIQKGILPDSYSSNGLQITPFVQQMGQVGGDLIDILPDSDFICTYLADASGHGVPASLITMLIKMSFEYALRHTHSLEKLLTEVNKRIYTLMNNSNIQYINYFTLFIIFLHPDFSFSFLSAGHLPAIHFQKSTGQCSLISTSSSMIGIFSSSFARFKPEQSFLNPGDKILVFSDGYTGAKNLDGKIYQTESLIQSLIRHHELNGSELMEAMNKDLENFRQNAPLLDDFSLLIIERTETNISVKHFE